MKKNCTIEISDEEIKFVKEKIKDLKKDKNFYCTYYSKKNYKDNCVESEESLNKVNLDIILEGEEIFVHNIIVPKVNKSKLDLIVENQVIKIFYDIENIIFNYEIIDAKRGKLEVAIYCINMKDSLLMNKELFLGSNINSVMPIQQLYTNKYKKKIKNGKFTLIIYRNKYVYMIKVENGTIGKSRVVNGSEENVSIEILEFLKEISREEENNKGIYIIMDEKKEKVKIANSYEMKRSFCVDF
ncbi:hypothetical protein [Clostridium sp.]|uniref:hypothetical protein n=1 Tax=Clostridium sp. TaxID=1506 RepID=UPI0032165373